MDSSEKHELVEPLTQRPGRERTRGRLTLVRGLGILLLSVPALLVFTFAGAYIYNKAYPNGEALHAHDYLSINPANKHRPANAHAHDGQLLSNGTHMFRPTLVLVSLDGFRADYLDRGLTPNLLNIGKQGLRADYMLPSFPSSTFPNHYTIVTGLYPGSHGIVSNVFYDTEYNDTFVYKDMAKSRESRWWQGGEPIWVTAEKQGQRAAIDMWPGSTAVIHGKTPSYLIPFSENVHPTEKTQQVLEWLDLPLDQRPTFLATYMPEVDHAAHERGPDAPQVDAAMQMFDEALGDLWTHIAQRNLTHIVNLMVVSDHGMAASRAHKYAVYLDDIIDMSKVIDVYNWPLGGIQPKDPADVPEMYHKLKLASAGQPWHVYLRDDFPERFHYTHPTRVAPIYVIPEIPYYVTTRAKDVMQSPGSQSVIGVHGYDNMHPLMRATFVAAGPAFRSRDTAAAPAPAHNSTWSPSDADVVNIQLVSDTSDDMSLEQVSDDGLRISDMDAQQEYLDLVRSALVSRPSQHEDDEYRAVYDGLWGEDHLSQSKLRNIRHPPFENVELYGLMTRILDLSPAPNNGTSGFYRWWLK
ncbi:hypothetical protein GGF43_000289 [Coemansia sp. RSA 2618]|nr:hypothetical protein GGF43_000289 [Coemansia sp. RSA 2618]